MDMRLFKRAFLLFAIQAASASLLQADPIDDYISLEMAINHLPGVALAVDRGGAVIKMAGYGLANVELNVPVTTKSVFQIQSVTKQFTATAIMMLMEEGKLSLDDKLSKHLEGTPNTWNEITIRHLLTQTSGIKDFINEPTASLRLEATEQEIFQSLVTRPLDFAPGQKYAYSNSNYHLLAMVIRKITGESYGDFLRHRVFDPLKMRETRIASWTDLVPNRVAGYLWENNKLVNGQFVAESILAYGGGGIFSTIDDMTKWDLALRGETLLKRSSLDQMWAPARLNDGTYSNYGFGWGVGGDAPHRFARHSGAHMTGFTSHILRFLDDDLSVIVLLNSRNGDPAKIAQTIAGMYLAALKPPERKPIEDKDPKVTQLLKQVESMIRTGKLSKAQFTAEMYDVLAAALPGASQMLKTVGPLKSVELLDRKEVNNGQIEYLYRLRFEKGDLDARFTLNKELLVTGLNVEAD
jgi:CubicO group peptidase (beta-lactamase class C family)